MAQNNIGPKRLVVGAHYGLKDWLAQRVTAVLMVLYTVALLFAFLKTDMSYESWAGLFSHQWFKLFSFVTVIALLYHAWVGMRDIWMDYVKPVGVRLFLQIATVLWLIACAGYAAQILWSV